MAKGYLVWILWLFRQLIRVSSLTDPYSSRFLVSTPPSAPSITLRASPLFPLPNLSHRLYLQSSSALRSRYQVHSAFSCTRQAYSKVWRSCLPSLSIGFAADDFWLLEYWCLSLKLVTLNEYIEQQVKSDGSISWWVNLKALNKGLYTELKKSWSYPKWICELEWVLEANCGLCRISHFHLREVHPILWI